MPLLCVSRLDCHGTRTALAACRPGLSLTHSHAIHGTRAPARIQTHTHTQATSFPLLLERGRAQSFELGKLAPPLLCALLDGTNLVLGRTHVRVDAVGGERAAVQVLRVERRRRRPLPRPRRPPRRKTRT